MRTLRCYCQDIRPESVLDPIESGHLCRVLRAEKGTAVVLFDGKGTHAEGTVLSSDKKKAVVSVRDITQTPPVTSGRIILAVSFAKGQRFDWLVEKCTELGVDHIFAVQFEYTVKQGKLSGMDRYHKIAIAAAKQSGRLFLPEISGPARFSLALDTLKDHYPQSLVFYGDPEGVVLGKLNPTNNHDVIVVIGPEGGFTENEINALESSGGRGVSINKNTLRIETAAAAFCSILKNPSH